MKQECEIINLALGNVKNYKNCFMQMISRQKYYQPIKTVVTNLTCNLYFTINYNLSK